VIADLTPFGPGARLEHVGLVVASIEAAAPGVEAVFDPLQKVRVAFVTLNGVPLELVEPAGDDSPVANSLRKGNKLVHLCYNVPDLDAATRAARAAGFFPLANPVPAVAFGGRRIAWVYSKTFGLVELLEAG
jgi:methylmalonyl-CoA/ethylmalonyl-CoA epimerase